PHQEQLFDEDRPNDLSRPADDRTRSSIVPESTVAILDPQFDLSLRPERDCRRRLSVLRYIGPVPLPQARFARCLPDPCLVAEEHMVPGEYGEEVAAFVLAPECFLPARAEPLGIERGLVQVIRAQTLQRELKLCVDRPAEGCSRLAKEVDFASSARASTYPLNSAVLGSILAAILSSPSSPRELIATSDLLRMSVLIPRESESPLEANVTSPGKPETSPETGVDF